jgi:hypothetical protein
MKTNVANVFAPVAVSAVMVAAMGLASQATVAANSDTCNQGYVWREASPADHVCVAPAVRSQTTQENSSAGQRRDPNGPYGPDTCVQGYVWREAFSGDHVCVTPASRDQATKDNAAQSNRHHCEPFEVGCFNNDVRLPDQGGSN